jgi:hypothetical protein
MVTKDFHSYLFPGPAKGHLNNPVSISANPHTQVGDIGNEQFQFVMVRIGFGNKAFGYAIHMLMVRNGLALDRQNPFFK